MPRQPRIRTIPLTKQANYELVWDLAGDMAARTSRTAEACWHQIIAAYWIGNLSTELFCFTRPKGSGAPGRALFALPSRDVLAEHLLGHERAINTSALAELSGWGLNDYQKHEPFRFYVARDPRFGLALRRTDFERWYERGRELPQHPARPGGAKPTKRQAVAKFIEENYPSELPPNVTDKTIVRALRDRGVEVSERTVRRARGRK